MSAASSSHAATAASSPAVHPSAADDATSSSGAAAAAAPSASAAGGDQPAPGSFLFSVPLTDVAEPTGFAVSGSRLYITQQDLDDVTVIDLNTHVVVAEPKFEFKNAELNGLTISEGRLYASDANKHCVRVFEMHSGKPVLKMGKHGQRKGELLAPQGLCVSAGEIFVAENEGHRISVFDTKEGKFLRHIAGDGRGRDEGQFNFPCAVVASVSGEEILVTEWNGCRVQVYSRAGEYLRQWGEVDIFKAGNLCVLGQHIYVLDTEQQCVHVFTPDGKLVSQLGSSSSEEKKEEAGSSNEADGQLDHPELVCAAAGRIYVLDTDRVKVFAAMG